MENYKRFEEVIKKYGFKIQKVAFRPEIRSVQFQNKHLMTIPKIMYNHPIPGYKDMAGLVHPDYYDCETKALAWNMNVKRTDFMEEDWILERIFDKQLKEKMV